MWNEFVRVQPYFSGVPNNQRGAWHVIEQMENKVLAPSSTPRNRIKGWTWTMTPYLNNPGLWGSSHPDVDAQHGPISRCIITLCDWLGTSATCFLHWAGRSWFPVTKSHIMIWAGALAVLYGREPRNNSPVCYAVPSVIVLHLFQVSLYYWWTNLRWSWINIQVFG